ncbi:MAG TPA: hypothetical protein VFS20_02710 [Longimicrobium sp.]|nr:hypothetical protein [Longimicrobium sp.]
MKSTPTPGQPLTPEDQKYKARAQDFANWLKHATPAEIEEYAVSINHFFESQKLDVDGIGFDIEIDEVRREHRDNLALLYRKTSEAMAHRNGLVSYANAPFLEDGVGHSAMAAQPFSIAATAPNLLARPMCYDAVNSTPVPRIVQSIECALRPQRDLYDIDSPTPEGGGGLHPSQVQFGIWANKIEQLKGGMAGFCAQVLRPNRVGLMLYTMPTVRNYAKDFLVKCRAWNDALNPGEGPNGQPGLPLQVPRRFGS